jgi:hypothetical protein
MLKALREVLSKWRYPSSYDPRTIWDEEDPAVVAEYLRLCEEGVKPKDTNH